MADEYIAVILMGLGLIYFLFKLGMELDEEHFSLKLFLIWMGIICFYPLTNLGSEIAESATMSADVQAMMTTFFYISGFIAVLASFYFGWYILRTTFAWLGDTINAKSPKGRRRIEKL